MEEFNSHYAICTQWSFKDRISLSLILVVLLADETFVQNRSDMDHYFFFFCKP